MAGPGAPSRPPPAAPHRLACRGARLTQGPAPGHIASQGRAGLRSAPPARRRRSPQITAAVSGSAGQARSGAGSWRRSDQNAGSGVGAASTARAPVATAELRGACARRGRGARACVCVGAGWAAARCSFSLRTGADLRRKLSGPLVFLLLLPPFSILFIPPTPTLLLTKPLSRKVGLTEVNSLQLTPGRDASHVF